MNLPGIQVDRPILEAIEAVYGDAGSPGLCPLHLIRDLGVESRSSDLAVVRVGCWLGRTMEAATSGGLDASSCDSMAEARGLTHVTGQSDGHTYVPFSLPHRSFAKICRSHLTMA